MYVNSANWHPFIPANTGEFGHYGWSGIVRGAGVIFFAYIGFDAVSTAAQEAKNPQRDLPIGILGSLAICTVLVHPDGARHDGSRALPGAERSAPGVRRDREGRSVAPWLTYLINIGAIAGLASVVLVMLLGQPRIFYSMARDGLLADGVLARCIRSTGRRSSRRSSPARSRWCIAGLFPIGLAR